MLPAVKMGVQKRLGFATSQSRPACTNLVVAGMLLRVQVSCALQHVREQEQGLLLVLHMLVQVQVLAGAAA